MPIQNWSEGIWIAELGDEPQFSEDMSSLDAQMDKVPANVVISLQGVTRLNSSNIAQMLRLRQKLVSADRHLQLCCVPDNVWGVMLVTGLDKVFHFSDDMPNALAALQLES